jgi:hypothetical protein
LGGASRDTGRSVYTQDYFADSIKPSITSSGAFIQPKPAGDLDGDGTDDVLVGFGSYDASKDLLLDRIDAVSGSNGMVLWSITYDVNRHIYADRAGDLNGDDKDDVLTFTIRYDSGTDTYALESLSALSGEDGAVLWSKDINTDLWGVWTEFDFNGDGMDDIIVQYKSYESSIATDCIDEMVGRICWYTVSKISIPTGLLKYLQCGAAMGTHSGAKQQATKIASGYILPIRQAISTTMARMM